MSLLKQRWFVLQKTPPHTDRAESVFVNDYEFILAPEHITIEDRYIYKYNIQTDIWKAFIEYPKQSRIDLHTVAFNKSTNKLYLIYENNLFIMDETETKQWKTHFLIINPRLICANGTVHLIGGDNNSKHFIWNNTKHIFEEIYHFKEYTEIFNPALIHVPSKQIILLVGGYDGPMMISNIWRYCLVSNKWTKLDGINVDISACKAVLTSNENYVIIGGGLNEDLVPIDGICVLNIRDKNNYTLKKSSICCPQAGNHMMTRTGNKVKDECLVFGWIKELFKTQPFNNIQVPPLYVMKLIALWFNQEMIHWIKRTNCIINEADETKQTHFGIYLKQILLSCD